MDENTERMTTGEAEVSAEDAAAALEALEASLASVGIVKSATHGRIRLQLNSDYRTPENMEKLRAQLEEDERVKEVVINPRTGSVIVRFEVGHHGPSLLGRAIKEAELIGDAAFDLPEDEGGEEGGEGGSTYGKLDQQFADLMVRFDQSIYRWSNGRIHTRGRVFPLAIAGLGVAQMAIYGISLEMLPGPLLIWLAHDIHRRFGQEHAEAEEAVLKELEEKRTRENGQAQAGAAPGSGAALPAAA